MVRDDRYTKVQIAGRGGKHVVPSCRAVNTIGDMTCCVVPAVQVVTCQEESYSLLAARSEGPFEGPYVITIIISATKSIKPFSPTISSLLYNSCLGHIRKSGVSWCWYCVSL